MRRLTSGSTGSIEDHARKNEELLGKTTRISSASVAHWHQVSPAFTCLKHFASLIVLVVAGGHIKLDYQDLFRFSSNISTYWCNFRVERKHEGTNQRCRPSCQRRSDQCSRRRPFQRAARQSSQAKACVAKNTVSARKVCAPYQQTPETSHTIAMTVCIWHMIPNSFHIFIQVNIQSPVVFPTFYVNAKHDTSCPFTHPQFSSSSFAAPEVQTRSPTWEIWCFPSRIFASPPGFWEVESFHFHGLFFW